MIQRENRLQIGRRLAKSGRVVNFFYRKAYKKSRKQKTLWRAQKTIRGILERHPDWALLGLPAHTLHGWMIFDDGMLLREICEGGESDWTTEDSEAMVFKSQKEAERFIDQHWEEIGGGVSVLR